MTEVNIAIENLEPIKPGRVSKLVKIVGELDETNVDEKMQQIYGVIGENPWNLDLIFDFTGLGYLNSKSIGYLTDIYGKLAETNGKIAIFAARPNVLDTLQVVGLTQLINMYDSFEQAKSGLLQDMTAPNVDTPTSPVAQVQTTPVTSVAPVAPIAATQAAPVPPVAPVAPIATTQVAPVPPVAQPQTPVSPVAPVQTAPVAPVIPVVPVQTTQVPPSSPTTPVQETNVVPPVAPVSVVQAAPASPISTPETPNQAKPEANSYKFED